MDRRCYRCQKVKPLSEFGGITRARICKECRPLRPSPDRNDHRRALTLARRAAARAFDSHCSLCSTTFGSDPERNNWRLWPARKQGRLMLAELDALSLYSLTPEVLTTNFKALCSIHYYQHVVKEEQCPKPPIPVAALRRPKSRPSQAGSKKSSRGGTRTSGGRGTTTS